MNEYNSYEKIIEEYENRTRKEKVLQYIQLLFIGMLLTIVLSFVFYLVIQVPEVVEQFFGITESGNE